MSTISDPGIICFHCNSKHCNSNKIFTFTMADLCPVCKRDLNDARMEFLPFRLPFPFFSASQNACAVVIRPTIGDFLNDYYNQSDLHIAVTTSTGALVEFDSFGLRKHSNKSQKSVWTQCLLIEQMPEAWWEHWDLTLADICKEPEWTSATYKEDTKNCYSFVLKFLKDLKYDELSKVASNRTLFCEKYIIPRTTAAGKYISLYRKIRDNGFYIHQHPTKSTVTVEQRPNALRF